MRLNMSDDRKWARQEIDYIKWLRKTGTRWSTNGVDDTDSMIADTLSRVRNVLGFVRASERE